MVDAPTWTGGEICFWHVWRVWIPNFLAKTGRFHQHVRCQQPSDRRLRGDGGAWDGTQLWYGPRLWELSVAGFRYDHWAKGETSPSWLLLRVLPVGRQPRDPWASRRWTSRKLSFLRSATISTWDSISPPNHPRSSSIIHHLPPMKPSSEWFYPRFSMVFAHETIGIPWWNPMAEPGTPATSWRLWARARRRSSSPAAAWQISADSSRRSMPRALAGSSKGSLSFWVSDILPGVLMW